MRCILSEKENDLNCNSSFFPKAGILMELQDAVRNRRSIRSFLSKPVPEAMIQELIAQSRWAPSWGNTQPWEIIIATGAPLEKFKKENQEAILLKKPSHPDIPMPQEWPDLLKKRYKDLGKRVFQSLSIDRNQKSPLYRLPWYK